MARVTLENIFKSYGRTGGEPTRALDGLCLDAADGEFLVVVGPSGCGKTTALRIIAGLEEADSGSVEIAGQAVNQRPPNERNVAMVFQSFALYPHLSVYDNIAFGLKVRRVSRSNIEQRVGTVADLLELRPFLERKPSQLSGGEQQRTAIARALARDPAVLLLDEPFSNLDAPMRAQLRSDLNRIRGRLAATVIHVTHDQAEAMILGERIAVMRHGRILQLAPPQELYRKPANRFVAEFFGSPPMNFFPGKLIFEGGEARFIERVPGNSAATAQVRLRLEPALFPDTLANADVILGVRPEHITLDKSTPNTPPHCLATVVSSQFLGSEFIILLSGANGTFSVRFNDSNPPSAGDVLPLYFDATEALLFHAASGETIPIAAGKAGGY